MNIPADGQRPLRIADWRQRAEAEADRYVVAFRHGTLEVGVYVPQGTDPQTPHTRDELYVIEQGRGLFRHADQVHAFSAGDVLFVPAGEIHRFERFSEDFAAWVMFYGPEGGEHGPPAR
jgi:mannose-6-phosphate isomerase-like protein (cupin superfamily)